MPKRRRLVTPKKSKSIQKDEPEPKVQRDTRTARGRLLGALLDVLEANESDDENYVPPHSKKEDSSDDEDRGRSAQSPPRQSFVFKLFDRNVDMSQFKEDSPLYPICRAWIVNQPKLNYKNDLGDKPEELLPTTDSVDLPGPEGPPISRIPPLLPEQEARNKDNINLNYRETLQPSHEELLTGHLNRWTSVRRAWVEHAAKVEARYGESQKILNTIYLNGL